MFNSEANKCESTLRTYDNEVEENTLSTYEKEETVNAWHEETVKSWDGYISIYECVENICHSKYKQAYTETDSVKGVSISFMEEFSKHKSDFEEFLNHVADFE